MCVCKGVSVCVLKSVDHCDCLPQAVLLLTKAAAVRGPHTRPQTSALQQVGHSGEIISRHAALSNNCGCLFSALSHMSPEGLSHRCPQWELPFGAHFFLLPPLPTALQASPGTTSQRSHLQLNSCLRVTSK